MLTGDLARAALFAAALAWPSAATDVETRAAKPPSFPSVTYYAGDQSDHDTNFTFSLTAVKETGDLFYRLSLPDAFGWVAIGTGHSMKDSLILLHYANTNNEDIVYSPRISRGHVEPSYNKDIRLEEADLPDGDPFPNGIYDGTWFAAGHCKNCTNIGHGVPPLDLSSKKQAFIFAFGSDAFDPNTNSLSAPLRKHIGHGYFYLDMTKATVTKGDPDKVTVPALGTKDVGAVHDGGLYVDHDRASPPHALVMVLAFLVMFPLGIFAQRILGKTRLHVLFQAVGLLLVIIGLGLGIYVSKYFNRSKNFDSTHQILGIVVVILLLAQFALGFLHHRRFKKSQQAQATTPPELTSPPKKKDSLISAHTILGPLVLAAGVINGAIGFRFALSHWNLIYAPLVLVMVVLLIMSSVTKHFYRKRAAAAAAAANNNDGQQGMQNWGPPPMYPGPPPPQQQQPGMGVGMGTGMGQQHGGVLSAPPGPYNDGGWGAQRSRDDIPLENMQTVRPKEVI